MRSYFFQGVFLAIWCAGRRYIKLVKDCQVCKENEHLSTHSVTLKTISSTVNFKLKSKIIAIYRKVPKASLPILKYIDQSDRQLAFELYEEMHHFYIII